MVITKSSRVLPISDSSKDKVVVMNLSQIDPNGNTHSIIETMLTELGSNKEYITEGADMTCYFYLLEDNTVAGCAMVETVEKTDVYSMLQHMHSADVEVRAAASIEMQPSPKQLLTKHRHQPLSCGETDEVDNSMPPCVDISGEKYIGIKQLWVDKRFRRNGIAKKLLECIRANHAFGCVVAKTNLAFSQPTEQGRLFAFGYCGGDKISVY